MTDQDSRLLNEIERDPAFAAPLLRVRAARETAAHLRELRKQAGLTQAELGKRLGVSQARISQVESGLLDYLPPIDFIYLLADACGSAISLQRPPARRAKTGTFDTGAFDIHLHGTVRDDRLEVSAVAGSHIEPVAGALLDAALREALASLRIQTFEAEAGETRFGPETITRDIPDVSDGMLAKLDERGIVRVGTEVQSGDILVGKTAPQDRLTPEEKLLRAIFGERPSEGLDTSLRLPPGSRGTVVEVRTVDGPSPDERPRSVTLTVAMRSSISTEARSEAHAVEAGALYRARE